MTTQPPVLSFAERDRRWARVRGLLRERNLAGAVIAGFRAREMYESYISDDYNEGCVVFAAEGEPVVITWAPLRVMRARWSHDRGHKLWVQDYRVATSGTAVAEVMKEKRLGDGRLGVVGLSSQAPTEIYGAIPANFWTELTSALPKAQFEDVSEEFSHLMLVKSAEEMAQVRYARVPPRRRAASSSMSRRPVWARRSSSPKRRPRCCGTASVCDTR